MNRLFKPSFEDYLVANGWQEGSLSSNSDTLYFFKDDKGIMISGDAVDFGTFGVVVNGVRKPGCSIFASFTGVNLLNDTDWMLLLHITGAVPLKEFMRNAALSIPEAKEFVSNISRVFNPYSNQVIEVQ